MKKLAAIKLLSLSLSLWLCLLSDCCFSDALKETQIELDFGFTGLVGRVQEERILRDLGNAGVVVADQIPQAPGRANSHGHAQYWEEKQLNAPGGQVLELSLVEAEHCGLCLVAEEESVAELGREELLAEDAAECGADLAVWSEKKREVVVKRW